MAYSVIDIINLALGRIRQPKISSLTEGSTAADQASLAWPYIRDEVLEASDWTFAKTRKALAQNTSSPVGDFDYAYTLPPDFLRMCQDKRDDPTVYPNGMVSTSYIFGELYVQGTKYNYVLETLNDGTRVLLTDYDNSTVSLIIKYIRREQNPARYSASFVRAAADRLSAELAPVLTGSLKIEEAAWARYDQSLTRAKAADATGDYVPDETGNTDWEDSGR